jgi:aminoglycoside 6'-N-acetyltransferase
VRPLRDEDVPALLAVLADAEVTPWWGVHDEDRLRTEMADDDICMFAVERDGELIGIVQYWEETDPDYRHAALDIAIRSDHHRHGIGREALSVLIEHLIRERGHHRFTIDPAVENERAIRSYNALGFKPVGVMRRAERAPDGRWRDSLLMDLLADELQGDQRR